MHFLAAIFFPLLEQFITKIKLQIWCEYFLLSGSDTCGVLWGGFKGEVSLVRNASFLLLDNFSSKIFQGRNLVILICKYEAMSLLHCHG